MTWRLYSGFMLFVVSASVNLPKFPAQTLRAQGTMDKGLQIELSLTRPPAFENASKVQICLIPEGFVDIDFHPIPSESLHKFLRLIVPTEKHLVLKVAIESADKIPLSTLAKAVGDIRAKRDLGISTHVFFSMRRFFDEKTWAEMAAPNSKVDKLELNLVLEKPKTKNGSEVFLVKEGLVDMKGKAMSNQELRKILRLASSNNSQKECVVFVVVEKNKVKEIEMTTLAKAVTQIYEQLDPDFRTHVFIVVENPGQEKPAKIEEKKGNKEN